MEPLDTQFPVSRSPCDFPDDARAVCTPRGKMLSNRLAAVVFSAIAPSVTEGTTALFVTTVDTAPSVARELGYPTFASVVWQRPPGRRTAARF